MNRDNSNVRSYFTVACRNFCFHFISMVEVLFHLISPFGLQNFLGYPALLDDPSIPLTSPKFNTKLSR